MKILNPVKNQKMISLILSWFTYSHDTKFCWQYSSPILTCIWRICQKELDYTPIGMPYWTSWFWISDNSWVRCSMFSLIYAIFSFFISMIPLEIAVRCGVLSKVMVFQCFLSWRITFKGLSLAFQIVLVFWYRFTAYVWKWIEMG